MPVKIKIEKDTTEERIAALRLTIKNDEGFTLGEVCSVVGRSPTTVREICVRNHWLVKQYSSEKRNQVNLLVNPKTLALCRKK